MRSLFRSLCLAVALALATGAVLAPVSDALAAKKDAKKDTKKKKKKGVGKKEGAAKDPKKDPKKDEKAAGAKDDKATPGDQKDEKKDAAKTAEAPAAPERKGPAEFGSGAVQLEEGQRTAEADRKRDEAIEQLKTIIKNPNVTGSQKADLLFQLAELWIEKSKFIYFTEMQGWEGKSKAFGDCQNQKGVGKCGAEPKIENRQSELYRDEAIRLYDQLLKDYATYERKDEVLFASATNLYEKGKKDDAILRHRDLVTQYPKSRFIGDSYVAIAEHYFGTNVLDKARVAYEKALQTSANEPRLYNFALYKLAWCDYNAGEYDAALKRFQQVVDRSEAAKGKNLVALKWEALNDMILTFEKLGAIEEANGYYKKKASKEKARGYFAKLANKYFEDGGHDHAIKAYRLLIREEPNDPKAPTYQSNVVRAFEGLRQRDRVVEEMKVLVKTYKPGSGWAQANAANKAAVASAYEVTEGAMRELVTDYHQEAQKTKEVKTYRVAANIYREYLDSFADSDYAYNLRFYHAEILWTLEDWEHAAEQYELTYAKDSAGSYSKTAAYNALLCYEKLIAISKGELEKTALREDQKVDEKKGKGKVKEKKKIETVKITKDVKPEDVPKWEQKMIAACDRYAGIAGSDKRLEGDEINVRYKAAFIYYDRKHFTEAAKRFGDVILKWPTDAQAQKAADLSLNILEIKEEWNELARLSRAFHDNKKLAKPGDKWTQELAKIMEGAQYKYIDIIVYKQEKAPAKAAPLFRDFVKEFPKSGYADQALVYAMVIFDEAKQLDQAIAVGEQILGEYPDSKFRGRTTLDLANFYQQTSDFEKAAAFYEKYWIEWEQQEGIRPPDSKDKKKKVQAVAKRAAPDVIKAKPDDALKASNALYNAALWNEGVGKFEKAIGLYGEYIQKYRTVKDAVPAPTLAFNIALIHEKQKEWGKTEKALEAFIKEYEKSASAGKVFFARYKRAMALQKLKRHDEAVKLLETCAKEFPKLKDEEKKAFDYVDAYAHARFILLEPKWTAYVKLKFDSIKTIKTQLQAKVKATPALEAEYTEVLKIGSADWGIAALTRIGLMYQDFSKNFVDSPDPPGLDDEQLEMYRSELENRAFGLEEKAIEAYEKALKKSYELTIYNEHTLAAQDALNKFKPGQYGELRTVSYTGSEFFSRAPVAATPDATFGSALVAKEKPSPKVEEKQEKAPDAGKKKGIGAQEPKKEEAPSKEEPKKKGGIILDKSAQK